MKVYAVTIINSTIKLLTWPSQKAFMAEEKWCDPKFGDYPLTSCTGMV